MKKDRTCSPTFTGLCYNSLHNFLNFLPSVHRLIRQSVVFTVLSFNQRCPHPEFLSEWCHLVRTHFTTSVLESHGISFSALMKIVASTIERLASFLMCFCVFSASRAWLK